MYQKDYFLRILEDFFRFLSVILKLKKEQRYDEALQKCDETSLALLRINIKAFENLSPADALSDIESHSFVPQQLEIIAGLLYEKAELFYATGQWALSQNASGQSLMLYRLAMEKSGAFSIDADEKMKRLIQLQVLLGNRLKDC